jgi:hypothetical protein
MTTLLTLVATAAIGGCVGFGYHRFVGCPTGVCPIARSPWVSTIVGLSLGILIGLSFLGLGF